MRVTGRSCYLISTSEVNVAIHAVFGPPTLLLAEVDRAWRL